MNNHNTTQIKSAIEQVCAARNITCLHAIESGSRAWGFASPDSDYDVRLLYCHELEWYLSLFDNKDTFEFIEEDLLSVPFDIGGWDIKKALTLVYKSNAVIFEWLHSPIVYQQQSELIDKLKVISLDYFKPITIFHHYQGMANTAIIGLDLRTPTKLKKVFYLLRSLLAAKWVITHATPPPVIMTQMFELIDQQTQDEVLQLIALKSSCAESHTLLLSPLLQNAIAQLRLDIESPTFEPLVKPDASALNNLFRQVVFDNQKIDANYNESNDSGN